MFRELIDGLKNAPDNAHRLDTLMSYCFNAPESPVMETSDEVVANDTTMITEGIDDINGF